MTPSRIPTLLVMTDRAASQRAGRTLDATIAAALDGGAPAVLLREKGLSREARRELGARLRELTSRTGARLQVSSDLDLAREIAADGVHLAARDPLPRETPDGAAAGLLLGRSCHDGAEVARARDQALDYATVSPVAETPSKPGYGPALGEAGLAGLVTEADGLPLLALGGVTPDNVRRWRDAGAAGIAVMGAVMEATEPARVVARLLEAWSRS